MYVSACVRQPLQKTREGGLQGKGVAYITMTPGLSTRANVGPNHGWRPWQEMPHSWSKGGLRFGGNT